VTQQDQQSRATLREWILYMVKYPAYFYQATGFRATDANIERFAYELFRGDIRLGNIRMRHSKKNNKAIGVKAIADLLGTSCKMVRWHYYKGLAQDVREHWKTPIWDDAGQLWGYKRRLIRWAKARGIGKYAKQSISKAEPKAQAVRHNAAKLEPKRIHANMGLDKGKHVKAEAIVREVRQASSSSASQGQGHKEQ